MAQTPQPTVYEHDDSWDTNWLKVDDVHELYYEQYGKKDGKTGTNMFSPKLRIPRNQ
jgi:proline iminopeptidase